ncbi:MAG TPA: hypothetical protein VNT01_08200 [Symbiobacteriaceae bacterium]|nr:hypothetical protein [Symbiobacteriaceae bacterium]
MSLADFRTAVKAGQYQNARWLFVQLLDDPGLSKEEMAEAYCEASVAEYKAGHLHTAITWSKVAAKIAFETHQLLLLSRVSQNLIEFYRLSGDLSTAIETGLRWLAEYGDNAETAFRKGRFYHNLAVTYQQRDEIEKALAFYEKAWRHLEEVHLTHPDPPERERSLVVEVMALQNAAFLMLDMGLDALVDEVAQKAKRLIPDGNLSLLGEQRLLECYKLHKSGDPETVLAAVNGVFASATSIPNHQLFRLYWLAAQAHMRQGKTGIATAYAAMATQEAEETKDSRFIRLAHRLEKEIDVVAS